MIKVSTVIPAYNQAGFIDEAVLGAVRQIGPFDHEILVSSDGSTDETRDRIGAWVKRFPTLVTDVSEDVNIGISGNFRRLFDAADGDYIAILEGDDLWTSHTKLARQVEFMQSNPDCSMVFSKILVRNLPGRTDVLLPRQENIRVSKLTGADFLAEPTMNLIANFSCCLVRKDLVRLMPDRLFQDRFNEIAMAFFLERHGPIGFLDEVLSIYHLHASGVWTGSGRRKQLESGLQTRRMVLDVADPRYAAGIEAVIEKDYVGPLSELEET